MSSESYRKLSTHCGMPRPVGWAIYLYQAPNELKIKVSDNGVYFDPRWLRMNSVTLENMEDRTGYGGTLKLLTALEEVFLLKSRYLY